MVATKPESDEQNEGPKKVKAVSSSIMIDFSAVPQKILLPTINRHDESGMVVVLQASQGEMMEAGTEPWSATKAVSRGLCSKL
jgi:hypothetical protein